MPKRTVFIGLIAVRRPAKNLEIVGQESKPNIYFQAGSWIAQMRRRCSLLALGGAPMRS